MCGLNSPVLGTYRLVTAHEKRRPMTSVQKRCVSSMWSSTTSARWWLPTMRSSGSPVTSHPLTRSLLRSIGQPAKRLSAQLQDGIERLESGRLEAKLASEAHRRTSELLQLDAPLAFVVELH